MTERKLSPTPFPAKLTEAVTQQYPGVEIKVSFPDEWEYIHSFRRGQTPLYIAGMPPSQERSRRDQFYGLPPEINQALSHYRLYKLFEPRTTHLFEVAWNSYRGQGQIIGAGRSQLHLQPIGQAQVWTGDKYGVLWEAYTFESQRQQPNWQAELALFWQAVEQDMKVETMFSQPHEPTFAEGYTDFLSGLGYTPDPHFERWWRKEG